MIIDKYNLSDIRAEADAAEACIALRFGCYDYELHPDHQKSIDFAAEQADVVVIGVMPDSYVTRVKGPERPIYPQRQRAENVDVLEGVTYSVVVPESRLALLGVIRELQPDAYVEGAEYGSSLAKRTLLSILGVEYVIDEREREYSTTQQLANASSNLTFNQAT